MRRILGKGGSWIVKVHLWKGNPNGHHAMNLADGAMLSYSP